MKRSNLKQLTVQEAEKVSVVFDQLQSLDLHERRPVKKFRKTPIKRSSSSAGKHVPRKENAVIAEESKAAQETSAANSTLVCDPEITTRTLTKHLKSSPAQKGIKLFYHAINKNRQSIIIMEIKNGLAELEDSMHFAAAMRVFWNNVLQCI